MLGQPGSRGQQGGSEGSKWTPICWLSEMVLFCTKRLSEHASKAYGMDAKYSLFQA
jgi:hypothetical protein